MDCPHEFTLDHIDPQPNPGGLRTAILRCTLCDHRQPRITSRTDDEINAELDTLRGI